MVNSFRKYANAYPLNLLACAAMIGLYALIMTTSHYPLALLPGVGVALSIMIFVRPVWFYYLILFLIPFGQYRFKIDWVITAVLVVVLFLLALANKRDFFLKKRLLFPYIAILFAHFVIVSLFSDYPSVAGYHIILLVFSLLFYFYTLYFVQTRNQFINTIPKLVVWSVSACAFSAILGYFFNIAYFAESVDGGFKRGIGTSRDPNTLALLIIFTIPLVIYMIGKSKKRRSRFLYTLLLLIDLLAMVTTFSRSGAMVAFFVLLLVFAGKIKKIQTRYLGLFLSFLMLSALILFAMIPPSYWERQMSLSKAGDKAIGRRASYLTVAWESVKDHPFLGTGPGSFPEVYAKSQYALKFSKKDQSNKRYAHNSYAEIVVGTGLFGLAVYLAIFIRVLFSFTTSLKRCANSGDFQLTSVIEAYRASFVGLSVYFLTISNPYHKLLMLSLALSEIAVLLTGKEK